MLEGPYSAEWRKGHSKVHAFQSSLYSPPGRTSPSMSSTDKFTFVQSWLQSMYGEDGVPEYEVDAETIDALYEIATASQRNNSNALLVLEDTKTQIDSYKKKGTPLERLLAPKPGQNAYRPPPLDLHLF